MVGVEYEKDRSNLAEGSVEEEVGQMAAQSIGQGRRRDERLSEVREMQRSG